MYHRVRRKMKYILFSTILLLSSQSLALPRALDIPQKIPDKSFDDFDNNIIDFDDEYSVKYNKKFGMVPWKVNDFNKESYRYNVVKDEIKNVADRTKVNNEEQGRTKIEVKNTTAAVEITTELTVIPLELLSTTENALISLVESTAEPDLTVIPLTTTEKVIPNIVINQTVTLPTSTQLSEDTTITTETVETTTKDETTTQVLRKSNITVSVTEQMVTSTEAITNAEITTEPESTTELSPKILDLKYESTKNNTVSTTTTENSISLDINDQNTTDVNDDVTTENYTEISTIDTITNINDTDLKTNSSKGVDIIDRDDFDSTESDEEVPVYTELDTEGSSEVPEDYYDSKDVVPTTAPRNDALSVIFGLAGSVVESMVETVAERVVPKGIVDLFRRMQKQNEALEAEKLRSREENGGLGQFTRGIIKTISSGIGKPLSQLMAGVRDYGSLDSDRGFLNSLASGVTSVANAAYSMADAFKDRVQTIYPGTVWCGGGHSAQARSSDLGLFFFTDTCCRQHDACKLYIAAGETKYGLTNTGLFTRSHCSCDLKFRDCLRKTNSLVSAQIGLTYFNVLGPQCFRRSHPIVRCVRRTRITGQKCEEYELDYTKPKMWQWFDNETF
ncbi:uncharacterized protein [Epargyreus clarus]|uniref:uncharacterized protein n=1 Tax=Epargyreus clarus TaxID=520877 RepID=UPI003C2F203D